MATNKEETLSLARYISGEPLENQPINYFQDQREKNQQKTNKTKSEI